MFNKCIWIVEKNKSAHFLSKFEEIGESLIKRAFFRIHHCKTFFEILPYYKAKSIETELLLYSDWNSLLFIEHIKRSKLNFFSSTHILSLGIYFNFSNINLTIFFDYFLFGNHKKEGKFINSNLQELKLTLYYPDMLTILFNSFISEGAPTLSKLLKNWNKNINQFPLYQSHKNLKSFNLIFGDQFWDIMRIKPKFINKYG